jgi:hypothetical protein
MGPKKILWIHERDIKNYSNPFNFKTPEEGIEFLVQHFLHKVWSHGVFVREKDEWNDHLTIKWTPVIIIRENHQ